MKDKDDCVQKKKDVIGEKIRKAKEDVKKRVIQEREYLEKYKKAYTELKRIGALNPTEKQVDTYRAYCDKRSEAKSTYDWQRIVQWKSRIYRDLGLEGKARKLENHYEKSVSDEERYKEFRKRKGKLLIQSLADKEEKFILGDIQARCCLQTLLIESNNEEIRREIEEKLSYFYWSPTTAQLVLTTAKHLRLHTSLLKHLEPTTKEKYHQSESFARLLIRYKEIARENSFNYRFDKKKYEESDLLQKKLGQQIRGKMYSKLRYENFIKYLEGIKQ